jgi:hypothetical protein
MNSITISFLVLLLTLCGLRRMSGEGGDGGGDREDISDINGVEGDLFFDGVALFFIDECGVEDLFFDEFGVFFVLFFGEQELFFGPFFFDGVQQLFDEQELLFVGEDLFDVIGEEE